jgi:uncharacterized membrane protein YhfC
MITPNALLAGIGMIVVSIAFTIYALRRGGGWGYFGLGALAWTVTVAVKFMIAIPVNPNLYKAIFNPDALWAPGSILFYVYVGLMTGVTEVLMTWLLLRYTRLGKVPFNKALVFAVGFGVFEALLLGLSSLGTTTAAIISPQSLPEEALKSLSVLNDPLYALGPVAERFGTILVHTVCNLLLFFGVMTGKWRWMWVSFAHKSLLDAMAGFAQFWGVETVGKLWTIEAIVLLFGFISWWGIRKIAVHYPHLEPQPVVIAEMQPES